MKLDPEVIQDLLPLYLAGEATDTEGEAATVTGAWQSGIRAARAICGLG